MTVGGGEVSRYFETLDEWVRRFAGGALASLPSALLVPEQLHVLAEVERIGASVALDWLSPLAAIERLSPLAAVEQLSRLDCQPGLHELWREMWNGLYDEHEEHH